ncbi:hypothetical protein CPT03_01100 [Pedobacter ginsengisoli]|uniref:DUF5362 domain-containing protein n=1 Tax=Pedobacter ginsengisoli TaxID=363852 RepID=A0A2D1U0N6_9SPHI|nr:DUF5362 family protein [Pedobacter ginsengisoli]ATP55160.1 hypothetical protein CPT03_01100 [Pedobacter ginsengisoli]
MEYFEEENPEETTQNDPQEQDEVLLTVTEDIRSYIYETAKWTKFLSIVGFVVTGIMILFSFSAEALISTMNGKVGAANNPWAALGGGFLTVVFLLSALLYFYPSLLMFKYANSAKQAVLYGDQPALSEAMSKMKSFFKFWGIITITILGLYIISFLLGIVAYLGAGSVAA